MLYTAETKRAMKLCFEAHKDQTDKGGLPYVFHPFHVAEQMIDEDSTGFILCISDDSLVIEPRENVLFLHFVDITDARRADAFTAEQAAKICSFWENRALYSALFVCCDSGESRSPAIAAALMRSMGRSYFVIWQHTEYHPNPYVYTVMCRELGMKVDSSEVKERRAANQRAFERQIKQTS